MKMKFNLPTSYVETIGKGNEKKNGKYTTFKCLLCFNWKSTKVESCRSICLLTQCKSVEKIILHSV